MKELDIANITRNRPHRAFVDAINTYNRVYAATELSRLRDLIDEGKTLNLTRMIERFRDQILRNENLSTSRSAFNTFKNDSDKKSESTAASASTSTSRPPIICACGAEHKFHTCVYHNPGIRPTGWKGDEEILKKIEGRKKGERYRM